MARSASPTSVLFCPQALFADRPDGNGSSAVALSIAQPSEVQRSKSALASWRSAARGRIRGQDRQGATCLRRGRSIRRSSRDSEKAHRLLQRLVAEQPIHDHRAIAVGHEARLGRPGRIPAPDPQATPRRNGRTRCRPSRPGCPRLVAGTVAIPTAQPVKRLADHRHKLLIFSTTPVLEKRRKLVLVTPCCQVLFFRRIADSPHRRGGPAPLPAPWFPSLGPRERQDAPSRTPAWVTQPLSLDAARVNLVLILFGNPACRQENT